MLVVCVKLKYVSTLFLYLVISGGNVAGLVSGSILTVFIKWQTFSYSEWCRPHHTMFSTVQCSVS